MRTAGAGAKSESFTPWAAGVFLVALALRAVHLWQLSATPFFGAKLGDAEAYDAWARQVAAGDWLGHEVFFQAPLYPYFLGLLYATLGDSPWVVRGAQTVLSALACALVASAGARLFSRGAGLVAGLLLATYAPSIFLDTTLQKSVLDVLFIGLALWLVSRVSETPRPRLAAALGLATGGLALARENALVLAAVLGAWLASLPGVARPRRLAFAALFAAGLGSVLLPVALRNWWVGGEPHLTTSQFGANFYIGNHPGASGGYEPFVRDRGAARYERSDITALAEQATGRTLSPGEVSDYWARLAFEYIAAQPADWLRLMARKGALFLGSTEVMDTEDQYAIAAYSRVLRATAWPGRFGVLAPLAVLGAFVTWPRRRELWWLHAAIAAYAASVLIFYVVSRYRYPLAPFLALLAGAGLVGARDWAAKRSRREVLAGAALTLGLAAFSNLVTGVSTASMAAVTHVNLANALKEQGRLELALAQYRDALTLDPGLGDATNGLADALLSTGRPGEAIAAYERSLAASPDDARLHANLAAILRTRGEPQRALAHYQRALELDPGYAVARGGLADVHLDLAAELARRGDGVSALEHYRSALALRPDWPAAMWGAVWILATRPDAGPRRPGEAVALAERAAGLAAPLTAPMLEALAAAYAADGRFDAAIARAREAVAIHAAAGEPPPERLSRALAAYERGEPFVTATLQ